VLVVLNPTSYTLCDSDEEAKPVPTSSQCAEDINASEVIGSLMIAEKEESGRARLVRRTVHFIHSQYGVHRHNSIYDSTDDEEDSSDDSDRSIEEEKAPPPQRAAPRQVDSVASRYGFVV
jgi:hypothetical protein